MTFSRKIFVAVFLSTFIVGGGLIWGAYSYVSKQAEEDFVSRYTVFSKVLADTLSRLDTNTEALMRNAAELVAAKDKELGLLSTDQLKAMRQDLNVTHIFVVDKEGNFIRSTNEDPSLIPNAYSFCPRYRNLAEGTSNVEATPIIHPHPEPKPYKFLFVPNHDRERLIEVGVRIDFIAKTLTEALGSDSNLISLSLYPPNGVSFGRFNAEGVDFDDEEVSLPSSFPSWQETRGSYRFFTKVESSHPQCCQCDVSGTSVNGEYYYVLKSEISKKEIKEVLATTKTAFVFLGVVNLFLALILGRLLSRRLVKNIEKAASKVQKIKESGNLKGRIKLVGKDEVSYLTDEFDRMLDSLEESQQKIVEAERVEAKVKMAREVAHNIRSPIVAIEMMLPTLVGVSSRVKGVLKSSVKEIKNLSQKLSDKNNDFALAMSSQRAKDDLIFLPVILDEVVAQKQFEFNDHKDIYIKFTNKGDVSKEFVKADPTELKAILSNLINNSIEAFNNKCGFVDVVCVDKGDGCVVEVIDNGVGIPKEYINKLGTEAITFKGQTSRGTGLVHAFEVIKGMGGEIEVVSEIGKGTTIRIEIPRPILKRETQENLPL